MGLRWREKTRKKRSMRESRNFPTNSAEDGARMKRRKRSGSLTRARVRTRGPKSDNNRKRKVEIEIRGEE